MCFFLEQWGGIQRAQVPGVSLPTETDAYPPLNNDPLTQYNKRLPSKSSSWERCLAHKLLQKPS